MDDPYLIAAAEDLNNMRYNLTAHYKMVSDVYLDVPPYNEGEGWLPIGSKQNPFVGHFDGNDKTIWGLYINRPDMDNVGLFGWLWEEAVVEHVNLRDVDVTAREYVDALVGWNSGGQIFDCSVFGTIKGKYFIGGLIGMNTGIVTESYATGNIAGNFYVGGLVVTLVKSVTPMPEDMSLVKGLLEGL
jgi:hypothetical protein